VIEAYPQPTSLNRDGLPDQVPGALPQGLDPREADGNAVFLRLRDGRIVF
jgi:hypothetical protein